jgi:hypothetical protein
MYSMFRRSFLRIGISVAGLALAVSSFHAGAQDDSRHGRKYKAPPPSSRIEVTVLRAVNDKPIEHAAVIFHPMEGDRNKGDMELKSGEDGKAVIDVIPIGDTIRLQVIANGFQTYGQDFKVDKSSFTFVIRMKRPGEQYSIYKTHDQATDSGAGGDKPADSPKNADNQPSPSKPQTN